MSRTKILVVEDEPVIALDIEECLMRLGYEVVAIVDCSDAALTAVTDFLPDLVLMDIHLQGDSNGIETAQQIWHRYHLPVVFLTAHADGATLELAKATQPFGYIVKPFETRDLTVTIEIALHRYQAEMTMQQALAREQALNRLKSQFVSIVSHEFRNPLSSILFSLDLMDYASPNHFPPEKRQAYLQRARLSVEQMMQMLEDVLMLSEINADNFQFQPQPLLVVDFCQELIEQFQIDLEQHYPIQFTYSNVDEHSLYDLDEKLLRHILSNLLSNAIKYSPAQTRIEFELSGSATQLVFRIRDFGIGIPVQDQDHLFDAFYRGSNVGSIPGTGLGLSIVKQCVEAHHGQISMESQVGMGTTFVVTLGKQSASLRA
ncbi:MAG: response regulator [Synechococcales cyanobacterium C42_A2020_086]|jgi:signal transduction histidine kinase|nr:response regulator [Synechococcales cyanobacterium C42_A2020_086]